jgi:RNA polymerase sigma-70 factor (ECF subfamily)
MDGWVVPVACETARNTATSFEPQCGDVEADTTILAIFRFRTEVLTDVTDDLALVERFLRGRGEDAFRALYRAHTPALYALAVRLAGGDRADAEDLVQESWVRALTALQTFRAQSALRSWLCGVLVNVHRGRIRADWRIVDAPDVEPLADTTGRDDAIDLERAIAALPEGARDVYVLHDVHGYTHREIAELMGIVEGTSKSQLNRARSLLRSSLP